MSDKNPICHHKFSAFQKFATGCDKCHLEVTPYKLGMLFTEVKCLKNELVLAAEDEAELNARIKELESQLEQGQPVWTEARKQELSEVWKHVAHIERIANLEKWLAEMITLDPDDFAILDIDTTLSAYGLTED